MFVFVIHVEIFGSFCPPVDLLVSVYEYYRFENHIKASRQRAVFYHSGYVRSRHEAHVQ
jgi:hypothetical protein